MAGSSDDRRHEGGRSVSEQPRRKPVNPMKVIAALAITMQKHINACEAVGKPLNHAEIARAFEGIEHLATGLIVPVDEDGAA